MFRGDWRKRFPPKLIAWAVVASFALTVGVSAISFGFLEQVENDWHSYERKAEYANDTYGPAYSACLASPLADQPDCIAKANNEYRKNEREQDDLAAQQTTAVWTFLMGCAAIVGMMLSAVGVILVYTTFHATRESNAIAQLATRKEFRPWLVFDSFQAGFFTNGNLYGVAVPQGITVTLTGKNVGRSPAVNANATCAHALALHDSEQPIFALAESVKKGAVVAQNSVIRTPTFGFGVNDREAIVNRTKIIWVYLVIDYQDPADPTIQLKTEAAGKIQFSHFATTPNGGTQPVFDIEFLGPQNDITQR